MTDIEQPRLFRLAIEAIAITAHYEPARGWTAGIIVRRGDESWDQALRRDYSCLSSTELVDVLDADLVAAFGL
jgi:hypothetical protein